MDGELNGLHAAAMSSPDSPERGSRAIRDLGTLELVRAGR
jgi:hypothetical protein